MMIDDNDPIRQIEQFKLKICEKGYINQCLLEYLGISAADFNPNTRKEENSEKLFLLLKEKMILSNKCEFREFLETISHLWIMHQQKNEVKYRIEALILKLKGDMKNIFSEKEIFSVFRYCKNHLILLVLVEHNILSIDTIFKNVDYKLKDDRSIIMYFYPEIRNYDEKYINQITKKNGGYPKIKKFIEKNDQNLEFFYEMRKEGEKEPKIIELIREDKIDEFISFVELSSINLKKNIEKEETIFGTNTNELTPIEYSVLFGSVAIFKYLFPKNEKIKIDKCSRNIIEYAIQGRNLEIIHLLEERKEITEELNKNQEKYLEVSIKMHYNEIFEYLISNYNIQVTGNIIKLVILSRYYFLFNQLIELNQIEYKDRSIISNIFHCFCNNGNEEIVKTLINQPYLDINWKDGIFDHSVEMIIMNKKTLESAKEYSSLLILI